MGSPAETGHVSYQVTRCTHHDPAESAPRRPHWHIEQGGDRLDLRFDSRDEAAAKADQFNREGIRGAATRPEKTAR